MACLREKICYSCGIAGAGARITYQAAGDGDAVISAADEVTGWTPHDLTNGKRIYKAAMDWTLCGGTGIDRAGMDQVFVDGEMMVEARWPDLPDSVDPAAYRREYGAMADGAGAVSTTVTTYSAPGLASLPAGALTGGYFHAIAGAFWTPMTGSITAASGSSVTLSHPAYSDEVYYRPRSGDFFYLWGTPGLLDNQREWHRSPDGTLRLWIRDGGDPAGHRVEAKRRMNVLVLEGRSYLTFKGLRFLAGGIRADDRSAWLLFDDVDCRYSSHYALAAGPWSTRGLGVVLRGEGCEVRNSTFAYSAETVLLLTGRNAMAVNNVVHDGAYIGCDGYVLGINDAEGAELRQNTAYGCGTNACIDLRRSAGCKVLYNDCFEGSRITCDGGMVMATRAFDGQGAEVAFNYMHDARGLNDGARQLYGTSGFYCEGNTRGYLVHHNIIWNVTGSGIALGPGGEGAMSDFFVYNNSLYADPRGTWSNIVCGSFSGVIKNNSIGAINKWSSFTGTVENNFTTDQTEAGAGNIKGADWLYAAPANGDFSPKAGSVLIDNGQVIAGITDGYTGSVPDIGALESGKPVFIAGAVITQNHIADLTVTWDTQPLSDKIYTVSGMPAGRKLPQDFRLKIGTAAAGGTLSYNIRTGVFTVTGVADGGQHGLQPLYGQIGAGQPIPTGESIDLDNPTGIRPGPDTDRFRAMPRGRHPLRGAGTDCEAFGTDGRSNRAARRPAALYLVRHGAYAVPVVLLR